MPRKLILGAALSLAAFPAAASDNPFAASQADITIHDLDLSMSEGMERFEARAAFAADKVCGISVSHLGGQVAAKARNCRQQALAEARERLAALRAGKPMGAAE